MKIQVVSNASRVKASMHMKKIMRISEAHNDFALQRDQIKIAQTLIGR